MKEYGGYIELDTYRLPMLHEGAIALNCGRNCLAYLIETKKISKIKLPYFLCSSVVEVCKKYNVQISFYHINEQFKPIDIVLESDEWLYVVNYYGQLSLVFLSEMKESFGRLIVDNSQAYYDIPVDGVDTLYTCRKFFGVPDGAFLYSDVQINRTLQLDESFERMRFLLGRFERSASEFYADNVANNRFFINQPIKQMSKLTYNLLHGIDYEFVNKRRTDNYQFYNDRLKNMNILDLQSVDGAFAYPLLIEDGYRIRKELQQKKIYVPMLWPNVESSMPKDSLEHQFALNILPLPCDQRYTNNDIEYIIEEVQNV